VVFEGRYGVAVGEGPGRARRAFEAAVAEASRRDPWLRDHQPTVEWWGGQFEPASIPVDHPLVTTVSEGCRTVTGLKPTIEGVPYGSDMRLMVKVAGTPTVLFGPGDVRRAHGPNEFVHVRDLEVAVKSIALTVLRFCGQEGDGPRRVNPHGATPGMPPGPWTRVLF
jgi:acetylornithine deacetylase